VVDGRPVVVSGSQDKTVRVWDLGSDQELGRCAVPDSVRCLAVAPTGHLVVGFGWEICCMEPVERWEQQ